MRIQLTQGHNAGATRTRRVPNHRVEDGSRYDADLQSFLTVSPFFASVLP
jgi:hypothetical protein